MNAARRTLALVRFAVSRELPPAERRALLERTSPTYRSIPGLRRKHFLSAPGEGGGLYEFEDRELAQRYFDAAWRQRMHALYGIEPTVELFDAPCIVDNVAAEIEFPGGA